MNQIAGKNNKVVINDAAAHLSWNVSMFENAQSTPMNTTRVTVGSEDGIHMLRSGFRFRFARFKEKHIDAFGFELPANRFFVLSALVAVNRLSVSMALKVEVHWRFFTPSY